MNEPDWVDPATIQVGWLNNETSPGIFLAAGLGILVWVVMVDGVAHGIRISATRGQFLTWKLEPGFNISGVYLGPVELQLDAATIDMPSHDLAPGDLLLEGSVVLLQGASDESHFRAPRLVVARLTESDAHPFTFRCARWSLVRPSDDERQEVFRKERDIATQA